VKKGLEPLASSLVALPGPEYYGFLKVACFDCPPFLMFTANDCGRSKSIINNSYAEPESMRLWCHLCRTATAIIDVGAQVGVFSLCAASVRDDVRIYAFEPNPYAYARLRVHKNINGFDNIVESRSAALNKAGCVTMAWWEKGHISSGTQITPPTDNSEQRQVVIATSVRLDDALRGENLGERILIKIDVEGSEYLTFVGMPQIVVNRPDIILETFDPAVCERLNNELLPLGYKVWAIDETNGRLERLEKITSADVKSKSFNCFLSVREEI
jgi:FkbM family methyltransferase